MSAAILPIDAPPYLDTVLRVLDESSLISEDAISETWRQARATYMPRRWALVGKQNFVSVPPVAPVNYVPTGTKVLGVRIHYIQKAVDMASESDTVDPSIPNYYQESIRYAAMAYLMEQDTDQKSMQLKAEMMASFDAHMAAGLGKLAVDDVDS